MKQISDFLAGYSKIQKQAVLHGEGALLLSAGPGSGKTHVLTGRIFYMVKERQILPEKIVVITFTKDAAVSMEEKYRHLVSRFVPDEEKTHYLGVKFATFHSFYYQILKKSEQYRNYSIISTNSQNKLIQYILENSRTYKNNITAARIYYEVEHLKNAISIYKNTLDRQKFYGAVSEENREEAEELWSRYEVELKKRKQLDMDDLIYKTYLLLKRDEDLLARLWDCYDHFMVDEFQDSNELQYRVLTMLTRKAVSVFAVGDEDQAIYGFRGAKPNIMKLFLQDRPGAECLCMGENYRSCPAIVMEASKVIRVNKGRQPKKLVAVQKEEEGEITYCRKLGFESRQKEYEYVCEMLKGELESPQVTNAVLFRTNFQLMGFVHMLKKKGIPYATKEKISCIYEHPVVRDIMAYLLAAGGRRERTLFLRIFRAPYLGVGREALSSETVDLRKVVAFYEKGAYKNETTVQRVEALIKRLETASRMSLPLAISYVRNVCGYDRYLSEKYEKDPDLLASFREVLEFLIEEAREFSTVTEWCAFQERYMEDFSKSLEEKRNREVQEKEKDYQRKVSVLTFHGSKGLEYERVFLMDLNEGNVPKLEKGKAACPEHVEEERRLFYVGMTRAKKRLELLYVTGERHHKLQPSRFLNMNQSSSDNASNS